jgi:hypothetical protein
MSNGKTPNGTKHQMKKRRMGQNAEWKYGKKNMCKYFWFFITTEKTMGHYMSLKSRKWLKMSKM